MSYTQYAQYVTPIRNNAQYAQEKEKTTTTTGFVQEKHSITLQKSTPLYRIPCHHTHSTKKIVLLLGFGIIFVCNLL